jgi:hypothetical protein
MATTIGVSEEYWRTIVNPMSIGMDEHWYDRVSVCFFGVRCRGMVLRRILPEHHVSTDPTDVIGLGMGLTATLSALVLALLIVSAKSSYDTQRNELTQASTSIILFDRVLATITGRSPKERSTCSADMSLT